MLIKDVMTRDLLVVAPDATLEQASAVMRDGAVGALPVVSEEEHLLGIVTDRDLVVRALAEGLAAETPVEQVMTREVTTVGQTHELEDALALMQAEQLRRLPVVDDGRLVGIIAQADLAALSTPTQFADAVRKISEPAATRTEHRAEWPPAIRSGVEARPDPSTNRNARTGSHIRMFSRKSCKRLRRAEKIGRPSSCSSA